MIKKQNKMITYKRKREDDKNYYKISKRIKNIEKNIEKKYTGAIVSTTNVPLAGTLATNIITGIVQGTNSIQRLGDRISVTSIQYKMYYEQQPDPLLWCDAISWYLIYDRNCNGSNPSVTDILSTANVFSYPNNGNKKRFKILRKGYFELKNTSIGSANYIGENKTIEGFVKFKNPIILSFKGNTGAVTDLADGNFYLLSISLYAITSYQAQIRVRFQDA